MADTALDRLNQTQVELLQKYDDAATKLSEVKEHLASGEVKVAEAENASKLGGKQATDFALLNGNSEQRFKVADAVNDDEAVNKGQMDVAVNGAGKVLQIVYNKYSTKTVANTKDLRFLTTNFTPKSATSTIIVAMSVVWGATSDGNADWGLKLYKDGVVVPTGVDVDGSRGGNDIWFSADDLSEGRSSKYCVYNATGVISVPSTGTSPITFEVAMQSDEARDMSVNRTYYSTNTSGISTMIITEVEN